MFYHGCVLSINFKIVLVTEIITEVGSFFYVILTKDGGLFESMKISYGQLENVPTKVLYEANLKTMNPNSLLKKEVNPEMFDELLDSHGYDPSVSVAAFDEDTGECVGMVLNGIRKDRRNTAYDILTCTIPEYRRMGIAKTIFEKVIPLLKEKGFTTYTTETKRTNLIAQNMYRSIGFEITKEVVTTLKTQDGTRCNDGSSHRSAPHAHAVPHSEPP